MEFPPSELNNLIEDQDLHTLQEFGSVQDIARMLDSDPENGIQSESIPTRTSRYGSNSLPEQSVRTFFDMLIEALGDQTLLILIACAIVSLILEIVFASTEERSTAWIDGTAILMAVAIVSVVQASSNHKQELQFAAVNRIKSIFDVTVIRDGTVSKVKNAQIVVGDVVLLEPGDKIPADGLVIKSDEMKVDQSVASGESRAVRKSEKDPFLISGTHVVEGRGSFLVLCVGLNSQNGKIFGLLENEQKQTPLQEKLEDLAGDIGYIGTVVAVLTFAALTIGWTIARIRYGWSWAAFTEVITYLVDALTIIVVAVPEGLPLAVTISLAYSMRKMMTDNNFVRRLSACETMGNATVICTDKTGTLTMNEMNVERLIVGGSDFAVSEAFSSFPSDMKILLNKAISINSTAILSQEGSIGSQTECAILRLVKNQKSDYIQIRKEYPIVKDFQFDRIRKRMTSIIAEGSSYILFTKGATEGILPLCTSYMDKDGKTYPMDKHAFDSINSMVDSHCLSAYRSLAICYKNINEIPTDSEQAEQALTLIAVVSIRDSLRPSTTDAIHNCQKAGIRVIMITGDHVNTAKAIARDCGIAPAGGTVMSGSLLRSLGDDKLLGAVGDVCVVARSTPMDKHMIVSALQQRGEVVAVTGDGTNDVAALMKADVGLAMGKCGTELAKEASDIVVLDDDFKSIVSAVLWGRCIYNNIRRFLQFQLTANVVTLFISFISAVILNDTPFKAVQLLWVNLIMDSLGALALATGRPHPSLLHRQPAKRKASLISHFMIQNISGQVLFQIVVVAILLIFHDGIEARSEHHYTLLFNVFVYCQMFNLINARVVEWGDSIVTGIMDNVLFIAIMLGIGIVEFILVQFCGAFFSCTPLSLKEWIFSIAIGSLCVPFGALFRRIPETKFARLIYKFRSWGKKND